MSAEYDRCVIGGLVVLGPFSDENSKRLRAAEDRGEAFLMEGAGVTWLVASKTTNRELLSFNCFGVGWRDLKKTMGRCPPGTEGLFA